MALRDLDLHTGPGAVLGIDIGSTTAKIVLIRAGKIIYESYERHFSQARRKAREITEAVGGMLKGEKVKIAISGSAGMGVADSAGLPFVQEVFATGELVELIEPDTSAVIEIGGEDAKIIFFSDGPPEERMNGSCAGGTGAFIDQMATLMDVSVEDLDRLSLDNERICRIASRCGVFAKTDIQPLLNQGANKADIAAGIYQAVVDQTIAGLAQGRKPEGKVMFLGGPLHFCEGLRRRFKETLGLSDAEALFPEYGRFAVAAGAALIASGRRESFAYEEILSRLDLACREKPQASGQRPLFADEHEYETFRARHESAAVEQVSSGNYSGDAYLGIDCGSTTTKLVLLTGDGRMIHSYYGANRGDPVGVVRERLEEICELCGAGIKIIAGAVTGYGEELIKHAFGIDFGLVETMAHYIAARHFDPKTEFILDIGGQDIKCLKIRNGAIDSIKLNEACSSGCGSFIETFAKAMGYKIEEFAKLGLKSKAPVDLGSRCTVFMNSSVKQAQKDGAGPEDISCGLSVSVVKNALYKVIRAGGPDELGERIVVQGGTFLNDAVLRAFEIETGREVTRPRIAGLMGAFGAALYAKSEAAGGSGMLGREALKNFTHFSRPAVCKGCGNKCLLTVNIFNGTGKYISGNRCDGATDGPAAAVERERLPNLYAHKRKEIQEQVSVAGKRGTVGLPLALGMFELYPLWSGIFSELGFKVINSGFSSRALYAKGQYSMPSDTACYPAKLMHGHIERLIEMGADAIFAPCLSYNINEGASSNHYNCPVVAYYPELLINNVKSLEKVKFLYPYLNINDAKALSKELFEYLRPHYPDISRKDVKKAVSRGFDAYRAKMELLRAEGKKAVAFARETGRKILVLAGRPYHADPGIGHGIDTLAASLGFVVVSEDAVSGAARDLKVVNQWTYHARLYSAAEFAAANEDCELVQLVSFGCGLDAVTADEVKSIMESRGRLYTQIKIDEMTNLGAVKIRLRSLLGAMAEREKAKTGAELIRLRRMPDVPDEREKTNAG